MPVKRYHSNHHGRRNTSVDTFSDITRSYPEKSLVIFKKQMAGRSGGKITVRHQGGGEKQLTRLIDSKREKFGVTARVRSIEYDPKRNARIALLVYADGEKRYIVAPHGLNVGAEVVSSENQAEIKVGNRLPLERIPVGVFVHDVELSPGQGGKIARAAGAQVELVAIDGAYAQIRLPSSEIRKVLRGCAATIGQISNLDAWLVRYGKAGRMRRRGIRPTVRGKVMNPVDHRHGGGEGKHPIGLKQPVTYTGKIALGVKTRDVKKESEKLILARRLNKKRI